MINKETIEERIQEGVEITKLSQERDAIFNSSRFYINNLKDKYVIWKLNCKQDLVKMNHVDKSVFEEADSISIEPSVIGFPIETSSQEGQELLKNIRIETSKKLAVLRNILKERPASNGYHFILNTKTGDLTREPKSDSDKGCSFKPSHKRFKLLEKLVEEKSHSDFVSTKTLTLSSGYEGESQCRQACNEIKKKVMNAFKGNYTFIESKTGSGYRINPQIDISTL